MLERDYQAKLIKKIKRVLPGCVVLKNDSGYMPGVPDLLILYGDRWAMLEVKTSKAARNQPNQTYYVDQLDQMSYAAFIYPSNEEYVLNDLQQTLGARRSARVPQRV